MSVKQHNFYFVRYPLGGAGVHIANIISLSPTCAPRFSIDKDSYLDYLIKHYADSRENAHLPKDHAMVNDPEWVEHVQSLDYNFSNSVHTGHGASFFWAKDQLQQLTNKKYVLIAFANQESKNILRERELRLFNTDTLANKYYCEELAMIYNTYFSEPGNIDDDINLVFEVADIFKSDIDLVVNKLNTKYQLDIPQAQAQQLHTLWYNNIRSKQINYKETI